MNPIDILPVEDKIGDILFTREALWKAKVIKDINVVWVDLLDFLKVSVFIRDFWIPIFQLPKNN